MSYEGFSQFLCKKGHYWTKDCYSVTGEDICPICKEKFIWENMVDETNGSFEGSLRIDGYVCLEIKEQKKCEHCNSILETTYKIPKKRKR